MFALSRIDGHVAERLGTGLQNLLRRFESVCDLERAVRSLASNR